MSLNPKNYLILLNRALTKLVKKRGGLSIKLNQFCKVPTLKFFQKFGKIYPPCIFPNFINIKIYYNINKIG